MRTTYGRLLPFVFLFPVRATWSLIPLGVHAPCEDRTWSLTPVDICVPVLGKDHTWSLMPLGVHAPREDRTWSLTPIDIRARWC